MVLQSDKEKLHALIRETLMVLCERGLAYKFEVSLEALIGITLDKEDVVLINIKELINTEGNAANLESFSQEIIDTPKSRPRKRKRTAGRGGKSTDSEQPSDFAEELISSSPLQSVVSSVWGDNKKDIETQKILEENLDRSYVTETTEESIADLSGNQTFEENIIDNSSTLLDESLGFENTHNSSEIVIIRPSTDLCEYTDGIQEISLQGDDMDAEAVMQLSDTPEKTKRSSHGHQPENTETAKSTGKRLKQASKSSPTKRGTPRSRVKKDVPRHTPCELCGKQVVSSYMKQHLNLHRGIYLYNCEECGKGFMSKSAIDGHMATHTGVKKYSCPKCDMQFKHKQSQVLHLKKLHPIYS